MSKAIIQSNLGDGRYRVKFEYDLSWINDRIEALEQAYRDSVQQLLNAQLDVIEKQQRVDDLADAIDVIIKDIRQNFL